MCPRTSHSQVRLDLVGGLHFTSVGQPNPEEDSSWAKDFPESEKLFIDVKIECVEAPSWFSQKNM